MGYKKNWDVSEITSQVHSIAREVSSPYNDGYTSWYAKQDLYTLKFIIDQSLKDSPNFGEMEQQWLTDQEQKRIIKILKS